MPLTAITEVYKTGKVRTVLMLRESKDPEISIDPPTVKTARKWKAEDEVDDIISSLKHRDIVGAVQSGRAGLGCNPFKPFSAMNKRERREVSNSVVKQRETESREIHLVQCAQQGQMLNWQELVVERKLGWQEIWQWSTSRLSFLLRSTYDVLPSPRNLVRWKVGNDDNCRCGRVGTLKHILSNCPLALERYTWRHNEVLKILFDVFSRQMGKINQGERPRKPAIRSTITFVSSNQKDFVKKPQKLWMMQLGTANGRLLQTCQDVNASSLFQQH